MEQQAKSEKMHSQRPWEHYRLCLQQKCWSQLDTQKALGRQKCDLSVARHSMRGAESRGLERGNRKRNDPWRLFGILWGDVFRPHKEPHHSQWPFCLWLEPPSWKAQHRRNLSWPTAPWLPLGRAEQKWSLGETWRTEEQPCVGERKPGVGIQFLPLCYLCSLPAAYPPSQDHFRALGPVML